MPSIPSSQRFRKAHPCPICGGDDDAPRGQGERCYGFLSSNGQVAHCTRDEYAGQLRKHPKSDTYAHRLVGDCRCGDRHAPNPPPQRLRHSHFSPSTAQNTTEAAPNVHANSARLKGAVLNTPFRAGT
jgi:hypothetical protein